MKSVQFHNTQQVEVRVTNKSPQSLLVMKTGPHSIDELHQSITLLPEQFFPSAIHSAALRTGEHLLMMAILEEAVQTYCKYRGSKTARGRRLSEETCLWFWSPRRDYLYAFERICLYLNLAPDYIRRGLARWSA